VKTNRSRRAFLVLAALMLSTAASLCVAASAGAATPCGKKVLGDWFDNGRIDRLYPFNCYEEAIDAIPPDIGPYSDAEDVITRALQAALGGHLAPGGKDPTPGDGKGSGNGSNGNGGSGGNGGPGGSGSPQAAPDVDTSGPSSVPIPLLVLGGMSVALLAAGGIGYVARRRQSAHADDAGDDETLV
jgi:hypothetical protein